MIELMEPNKISQKSTGRYFGPAQVIATNPSEGFVQVNICRLNESGDDEKERWAQLALPAFHDCKEGDRVLVAGDDFDDLYVIGVLSPGVQAETVPKTFRMNNGAGVVVSNGATSETVQIFSPVGDLLFEYNAQTGESRVHMHAGDLEFVNHNGGIHFSAAGDIRLSSRQTLELNGRLGLRLAIRDAFGTVLSSLSLNLRKLSLTSPEIGMVAQRGEFHFKESRYCGDTFVAVAKKGKLIVGRMETVVQDCIQKAKNVYLTVEELIQTRAGRTRTLVEGTSHFKSKKAFLKAEQDFKIKGEKIHLG